MDLKKKSSSRTTKSIHEQPNITLLSPQRNHIKDVSSVHIKKYIHQISYIITMDIILGSLDYAYQIPVKNNIYPQ